MTSAAHGPRHKGDRARGRVLLGAVGGLAVSRRAELVRRLLEYQKSLLSLVRDAEGCDAFGVQGDHQPSNLTWAR